MIKYEKKDISITMNEDEKTAVSQGLELIKAEELIQNTSTVVIAPNWVNYKKPDSSSGVTVGTDTFSFILQWIKKKKPERMIVGSGSGNGDTPGVMKALGYDRIIEKEGFEFVDFNTGPYIHLELNHSKTNKIKVNQVIKEMDVFISFTQLKFHEEATMSAAIKNMALTWPSTEEQGAPKKDLGIHEDLHGFICSMTEKVPIHLSVVSANPAMVGSGPTKGIPKHTGIVVCGNNPIGVDTVCGRLLGFKSQGIHYLYLLSQKGIGESNIQQLNIKGLSIQEAEKLFSQKVYGDHVIVDSE
jgi:uncharacterized protein (DUF362 family)